PELRFVHFAWRWLFPLCAAATVLASFAVAQSSRRRILFPVVAFALIGLDAAVIHTKTVYPHFVEEISANFQSRHGYRGLLEYTPLTSKGRSLPLDAPLIEPVGAKTSNTGQLRIQVEGWSPEKKVIRADLSHSMRVKLKLLAYP